MRLRNPVGLAAGFDKNAELLPALDRLGFGYAIPGSIRDANRQDAARPNMIRLRAEESLINCTGLPSEGGARAARRMSAFRERERKGGLAVIPSIGGFSIAEYVRALEPVQPHADAVEILLLCPNEHYEETNFLEERPLRALLAELNARKQRPFFVKIRNYQGAEERRRRLRLVEVCVESGVDGITLPGSRTVSHPQLSRGAGNLTGRAVLEDTIRNVRELYQVTEGRVAIKALGGISTGSDAFRAIAAGASTVELLTGLIYRGWDVVPDITRELLGLLKQRGLASVGELRGSDASVSASRRQAAS